MQDNTDQKNSKYGHFSHNVSLFVTPAHGHTWRQDLHEDIFTSRSSFHIWNYIITNSEIGIVKIYITSENSVAVKFQKKNVFAGFS